MLACNTLGGAMQLREGVRTEAEALALGRQVVACPALHLRGLMTHHGNLTAFQPIIQAFRDAFGQVAALPRAQHRRPSALPQHMEALMQNAQALPESRRSRPSSL